MNMIRKIALLIILALIIPLFFYVYELNEEIKEKGSLIQKLKDENEGLKNNITSLKIELEKVRGVLQNLSEARKSKLRNPSWKELKVFLEADKTNELIYNEDTFDCSGFALELFKHARANGLRCGFVEVKFEEGGHSLNVFQTDKGLVFVDVIGNEAGSGKDKVAYVKIGESYGTIVLDGIKEKLISCNVNCSQFAKEISYVNYSNIFNYNYFLGFKRCTELYENCTDQYNKAVEEYNEGRGDYTYSELQQWLENLKALEKEISSENRYFISEGKVVKNIQIYY